MANPVNHLHKLWGKAQEHPDYVKQEWNELQAYIEKLEAALGMYDAPPPDE